MWIWSDQKQAGCTNTKVDAVLGSASCFPSILMAEITALNIDGDPSPAPGRFIQMSSQQPLKSGSSYWLQMNLHPWSDGSADLHPDGLDVSQHLSLSVVFHTVKSHTRCGHYCSTRCVHWFTVKVGLQKQDSASLLTPYSSQDVRPSLSLMLVATDWSNLQVIQFIRWTSWAYLKGRSRSEQHW